MVYVIGVSSGIFGAAALEEKFQYAGLPKKAEYCITKGVQFVQVDLESISELEDPELKPGMKRVKELGVTFGIHSETRAFGVEVAELDSAIETDYKFGHERLKRILERSGEIESKYVLIHSSESPPFLMLERTLQPAILVDFFGNDFREFLEKEERLVNWLMGGKIEESIEKIFQVWLEKKKAITEEDVKRVLPSQDFMWREVIGYTLPEAIRRGIEAVVEYMEFEFGKDLAEMDERQRKIVEDRVKSRLASDLRTYRTRFLDYVRARGLSYGPERIAYYFVAKWMELEKDPLWEKIVKSTVDYFATKFYEKESTEEWLKEMGIEKLSIDDGNFRKLFYLWVPAVSAKYIWGHLFQDKNPKKLYPDLKPILKKYKMPLVLETPMASRGMEQWLRLPNPIQMYHLVKQVNEEAGFECLSLAMDFEHMLSIRLEPGKVIKSLPEDGGKLVRVIHTGWPAPLAPAHIPIPMGSEQQKYIYDMLYYLRQKGFGKDEKDYYIVFERGGGADPIKQSILALRKVVEFLEKDVKPEELILHPEFFGIEAKEFMSPERQRLIIFEHARDPLKGTMVVPEEEYTFLGRAAIEKGKRPEEWKKEELK